MAENKKCDTNRYRITIYQVGNIINLGIIKGRNIKEAMAYAKEYAAEHRVEYIGILAELVGGKDNNSTPNERNIGRKTLF